MNVANFMDIEDIFRYVIIKCFFNSDDQRDESIARNSKEI